MSAPAAPPPSPALQAVADAITATGAGHHVQFDDDPYPRVDFAAYLAESIRRDGAALAIGRPEHLAAIRVALAEGGICVPSLIEARRLVLLEGDETLTAFSIEDQLCEAAFDALICDRIRHLVARFGTRRALDEMVDILCSNGRCAAALKLERMWNRLRKVLSFDLVHAYGLASFERESAYKSFAHIRDERGDVVVSTIDQTAVLDRSRLVAHLEQRRRALRVEVERRQQVEAEQARRSAAESLVAEAARLVSSSLDYEETVQRVAELAVPAFADWGVVDLLTPDGESLDRVGVGYHRPGGAEIGAALKRRHPLRPELSEGVGRAIVDRTSQLRCDVDEEFIRARAFDDEHARTLLAMGIQSFVVAPLVARGREIGALTLLACGRNFDELDVWLAERLASSSAAAIDNARLFAAEQRARLRICRMQEVTAALSRARTATEVAAEACRIGAQAMEAHSAALWLLQHDGSLALAGSWGTPSSFIEQFRIIPADTEGAPALEVVRTGQPLWIETEADYRRRAPEIFETAKRAGRVRAYGVVPLSLDGRVAGVICLAHAIGHRYDADDRAFYIALGQLCSQALDHARLLDAERRSNERLRRAVERAENEAHRAAEERRRAEAANRIKDEFLATVSHELRTPLNAIAGWSSLLVLKGNDRSTLAKGLEVIRRNAEAQTKIVEDILDVSRIVTGKLKIDPRPVDMTAIVRDALEVVRPSADAKGLTMSLQVPSESACLLLADGPRLQQVVWNLLSNAIKFTDAGGQVTVRLEQHGPSVTVTVTDTGRGIEADFLPYVFDRFRQADSSPTRRFGGLGLGLSIVRHIVELHGGRACAESAGPGKGARFEIVLPVREVATHAVCDAQSSASPICPAALQATTSAMRASSWRPSWPMRVRW